MKDLWWTVFSAVISAVLFALALRDLMRIAAKWTSAWLIVNGWLP